MKWTPHQTSSCLACLDLFVSPAMAQSLLKRPLDLFYCAFFLVHAFCATIDAQQFLPASVFPSLLLKASLCCAYGLR